MGGANMPCALSLALSLLLLGIPPSAPQPGEGGGPGYRTVFSWGDNRFGELGLGSKTGNEAVPKPKDDSPGLAKYSFNHCTHSKVDELSWDTLRDETLEKIVGGHDHTVAWTKEGSLFTWGRNHRGQLGLGRPGNPSAPADSEERNNYEDYNDTFVPTRVDLRDENGNFLQVSAACVGAQHTAVVVQGGGVWTWGGNLYGQLGHGFEATLEYSRTSIARQVNMNAETVVSVACGSYHTVVLTLLGSVYSFGTNSEGQLGVGGCSSKYGTGGDNCLGIAPFPKKVGLTEDNQLIPPIKYIAAGGHTSGALGEDPESGHTIAVSVNNEVYAWGDNFYGQLGFNQSYNLLAHNAVEKTPNRFDNVTGKYYNRHVLPVKITDGGITWKVEAGVGVNGTEEIRKFPDVVKEVACGAHHTVLLMEDGRIFTWGDNYFGQLGYGTMTKIQDPTISQIHDHPKRITLWDYETEELLIEENENGTQWEIRTSTIEGTVKDKGTFIMIDAAKFHNIALTDQGYVYTWGTNAAGEQGTCGCGNCVAEGQCENNPPAPPPPPVWGNNAPPPPAPGTVDPPPPGPPQAPGAPCTCRCVGVSTCEGQGVCVGWGEDTTCQCTSGFDEMGGTIQENPSPMLLAIHDSTNYTMISVAAGAGLFVISRSPCPDDDIGIECSDQGVCNEATGQCECAVDKRGEYCELTCPKSMVKRPKLKASIVVEIDAETGEARDVEVIAPDQYSSVSEPFTDEEILKNPDPPICAGRGECYVADGQAMCECESNWFGSSCNMECPTDGLGRYCSGNGTCTYDPLVQERPWCECTRFFTVYPDDPNKQQQQQLKCQEQNLFIQPDGWCSFYSYFEGGYPACLTFGQCGLCEDAAWALGPPRWGVAVGIALALAMAMGGGGWG